MKGYTIQEITVVIGAALSFLIGPMDTMLIALVSLEIIDFACGIMVAWTAKNINSEKCFKGLLKKIFIIAMVVVGQMVDRATGQEWLFRNMVVFFYLANEAISIIENAAKMGLPIPGKLRDALEQLQGKEENSGFQ